MKLLKHKKIIIVTLILMILIGLSATATFAYNAAVDYNYDVTAYAELLQGELSGDTSLTVTRLSPALKATKADIVLIAEDESLTLAGKSPAHTASFEVGEDTFYKLVFTELAVTGSSTVFSANGQITALLKAAVKEAEYTEETVTHTVIYENAYVSNLFELGLLNLQSNYNNIFELAGHFYGNTVVARVVYLLSDLTVDEDLTINHPASLNLLDCTVTLNADFTIHHSYAGSYFVAKETARGVSGSFTGSGELTIKTPKAFYTVDATAIGGSVVLTEIYDYTRYGTTQLLLDALDFAENNIKQSIYSDMILQPRYQSYGVNYSYSIVNPDTSLTPFTGRVSVTASEGSLTRTAATVVYTVRIVASKGGDSLFRDVAVRVIGTGESALFQWFFDSFTAILSTEGKMNSAVDLSGLVSELFKAGYASDLILLVNEKTNIEASDPNAVSFLLNGTKTAGLTVKNVGGILQAEGAPVQSLVFMRGTVTVSDEMTLSLSSGATPMERTFPLTLSTNAEVMFYLKSSVPPFTTNKQNALLKLKGASGTADGIYLGETLLTLSELGLSELLYDFVSIVDSTITAVTDEDIYQELDGKVSIIKSLLPDGFHLRYKCKFENGHTEDILIPVIKSNADDGGENQEFESMNPFDALFMSTEINWLEGGSFEVPSEYNYAHIAIISINDIEYSAITYKMCTITNDTEDTVLYESILFYKKIDFNIDLRYVPITNSTVKVICYYYNSLEEVENIVLTQEYTFIIPGIFKCDDGVMEAGETPYVFTDTDFYDMTMTLFENYSAETAAYVSTLSSGIRLLLSDSADVSIELNYSTLTYTGSGIDTVGIEYLLKVSSIIFDNIRIINMSPFSLMADSALKYLSLKNCKLSDNALYGSPTATESYLYFIHLLRINLAGNSLTRTDRLLARTVTVVNLEGQRDAMDNPCLIDIAGLDSIKYLETLDISDNAIYRFEVLKYFTELSKVYLYNNRVTGAFEVYGTDGRVSISLYVWLIKTNGTLIYANASDLTADGYLKINEDAVEILFSLGGEITAEMQEGSVGLNAFASPTRLYAGGKAQLESDLENLRVQIGSGGATGGVDHGVGSEYTFRFYRPDTGATVSTFVALQNYAVVPSVSGTLLNPVSCSYIVTIIRDGNVLAMREYLIDIYCGV